MTDIERVYEAITGLTEGQVEFKEAIQVMGFEQKEIRKDVRLLVTHVESQNGHISELQTKEIQRSEREKVAKESSSNLKWWLALFVSTGMAAILAAAEGLRAL